MRNQHHRIVERAIHYLAVAVYTLLFCIALYWLVASAWWCGMHPLRSLRMFFWGMWHALFVNLWYVAIPMVAIIVLDVEVHLRNRRSRSPNTSLHGSTESRASASSSAP